MDLMSVKGRLGLALAMTVAATLLPSPPATARPKGATAPSGQVRDAIRRRDVPLDPRVGAVAGVGTPDQGTYTFADPSFDAAPDRNAGQADVVSSSIDYSEGGLFLSTTLRTPFDPLGSNWHQGESYVAWAVDFNGDSSYDYAVTLFDAASDPGALTVYVQFNGAPAAIHCGVPYWDGGTVFGAVVQPDCFDRHIEPLRYFTEAAWDADPAHPGTTVSFDDAPDTVWTPFIDRRPHSDVGPFGSAYPFVDAQYDDFLGRAADGVGREYWAKVINTAAQTAPQVIESFLLSPEFGEVAAPVTRLYSAYFLRIPDYEGIKFWIKQGRHSQSLAQISASFAASSEFDQTYGGLTDLQFVDLVYRNVLGRDPDDAGRDYWLGRLKRGDLTRGGLMLEFSDSAEYVVTEAASVNVIMIYVAMLHRSPDAAGYAFWVDQFDQGHPVRDLISQFFYSDEYASLH